LKSEFGLPVGMGAVKGVVADEVGPPGAVAVAVADGS
jgi:hypothetical protein